MDRVFKTLQFSRWSRKIGLLDKMLCGAIAEMEQGLVDANLGGGIVKKRVALPGRGKSGGVRTLVATNRNDRWFFVFGFAKNARTNISNRELDALQKLASDLLNLPSADLNTAVAKATLEEICHE
jgi:hypothetical protein